MRRIGVYIALVVLLGSCGARERVEDHAPGGAEQPKDSPVSELAPTTWDSAEWSRRIREAEQAMVRLLPASFNDIPQHIRGELEAIGCRVPQVHGLDAPHNVIQGHFASESQEDWAALCTLADSTYIVVLWGGPSRCPSPIEGSLDTGWFQRVGPVLGFSRKIGTAHIRQILRYAEAFDGPQPPAEDHDGIDHYFFGKASTILFCHEGEWHRLQGID